MTTNAQIEKAILQRTGIDGVRVSKAEGMCRFCCDNEPTGLDLSLFDGEYIPRLNMLTPSEWADRFEGQLKETKQTTDKLSLIFKPQQHKTKKQVTK